MLGRGATAVRILLVEDNSLMAELLAAGLRRRGIDADHASTLEDASACVHDNVYDAVLLDLGLPDGDGLTWLRSLPEARPPVIVLTARGTLDDRVTGLDQGADDYLVKPTQLSEIAARLRAVARRPGHRAPTLLQCDALTLDPATRDVRVNGEAVRMSYRETALLEVLMRNFNRVVTREIIESNLYGASDAVSPNAVEAVVSRLRKRLQGAPPNIQLHAIRGVGYMLGGQKP